MSERHFIFGYGSLINSISRSATGETGRAIAVKVSGFERHWSFISKSVAMSSVVVVPADGVQCNGVIVEIEASELPSFDKREEGYSRQLVSREQISTYADEALPQGNIWLYQTDSVIAPCEQHPIVLSYLDVILAGCLEYGEAFCNDFVRFTRGWESVLLNDRGEPRYPRVQPDLPVELLNPYIAGAASGCQLQGTYS
ncbi:MAG: gamma-glutamylcyclotransferase family protein [Pseudomonadales bacterium]